MRSALLATVTLVLCVSPVPVAGAPTGSVQVAGTPTALVSPPPIDAQLRPTTSEAGSFPYRALEQVGPAAPVGPCAGSAPESELDLRAVPPPQARLRIRDAQEFATGRGQTVAVIDSGVNPHPRLAGRLDDGGDYILGEAGTADCEGHGTVVAGIIAAAPAPDTGFVGVAPEARILSIRQSSSFYTVELRDPPSGRTSVTPAGDTTSMARAVVRAVETPGVSVINISEAACFAVPPAGTAPDRDLQAAVRYAMERDVVVVTAAANEGLQDSDCQQNPVAGVGTVVSPAWFDSDVLTVAATDPRSGEPAPFSIRGPWVDVAAPGSAVVSLDAGSSGLAATLADTEGNRFPIMGTSFAVSYVSGVAALIRERFPDLTAQQVIERIQRTAQHTAGPGGRDTTLGYGVIDPVAALTDVIPEESGMPAGSTQPAALSDLRAPEREAPARRLVAFVGAGAALGVLGVTLLTAHTVRRHRRRTSATPLEEISGR